MYLLPHRMWMTAMICSRLAVVSTKLVYVWLDGANSVLPLPRWIIVAFNMNGLWRLAYLQLPNKGHLCSPHKGTVLMFYLLSFRLFNKSSGHCSSALLFLLASQSKNTLYPHIVFFMVLAGTILFNKTDNSSSFDESLSCVFFFFGSCLKSVRTCESSFFLTPISHQTKNVCVAQLSSEHTSL